MWLWSLVTANRQGQGKQQKKNNGEQALPSYPDISAAKAAPSEC
jgi:hypothetical protein